MHVFYTVTNVGKYVEEVPILQFFLSYFLRFLPTHPSIYSSLPPVSAYAERKSKGMDG